MIKNKSVKIYYFSGCPFSNASKIAEKYAKEIGVDYINYFNYLEVISYFCLLQTITVDKVSLLYAIFKKSKITIKNGDLLIDSKNYFNVSRQNFDMNRSLRFITDQNFVDLVVDTVNPILFTKNNFQTTFCISGPPIYHIKQKNNQNYIFINVKSDEKDCKKNCMNFYRLKKDSKGEITNIYNKYLKNYMADYLNIKQKNKQKHTYINYDETARNSLSVSSLFEFLNITHFYES